MNFSVTTLVENTTSASLGLIAEHGLSLLIETGEQKVLFDTGQGMALFNNAKLLGVDLSQIDSVVLSHGHVDHAGGLAQLLSQNSNFSLFAHPKVFEKKLVGVDGRFTSVGVASDKKLLEESGILIKLSAEPMSVADGVKTTGRIPMNSRFEEVEPMFYVGEEGRESPDFIEDDLALILETVKGSVVILGCAHRGVINTLNHVAQITGSKKIHAIIGGMHLLHANESKMARVIEQLQQFTIDKLVVGHCTGFDATHSLRNAFGDRLVQNTVGLKLEF